MRDDYTPSKVDQYYLFALQLDRCGHCTMAMMPRKADFAGIFPGYYRIRIEEQMKRASIQWATNERDKNDDRLCEVCAVAANIQITCALCKQDRPRADIQESFGDPPEYLCKPCYTTVPANVWELKSDKLRESHRYDFE
jgi:hypothetical protein